MYKNEKIKAIVLCDLSKIHYNFNYGLEIYINGSNIQ